MCQRILVVDDDPGIRFTVREVLKDQPVEVVTADDGPDCLEQLRQGFQGLILLDIMMPEMDGWQTLRAMLDEHLIDGCVVCMLTAVLSPGTDMEPLKEVVLEYVRKPFTREQLIETVQNYTALV